MADISEKELKDFAKTPKGRKVLGNVMREAGIIPKKDSGDFEREFQKGYEEGSKAAEERGAGTLGKARAGMKAGREREEQFQLATMGTKRSREKFLSILFGGAQAGDYFRKNIEKKGSTEEIERAKKKFGLDEESLKKKKEEEEKAKAEKDAARAERSAGRKSSKIIGADKLAGEVSHIKNIVQSLAKFILVNRGYTSEIDPKTGKILYRNKAGQFAKSDDATFANFKNVTMKNSEERRTAEAKTEKERGVDLAAKISADEDPQIRIADTLEAILKTLGKGDVSIQEKLDKIAANQDGGGGPGIGDALDLLDNGRRGGRGRGRFSKIGRGLKGIAGKALGKLGGLGKIAALGGGAVMAGEAAAGIGANLGAGAAEAGSAASTAAKVEGEAAKVAQTSAKGASKVLKTAKNVLGFLKKVPGLTLIASGAALIMEIKNAIDAHERGEITDAKLHSVVAGAVGGALGGIGGAELVGSLGAAAGTIVLPGAGTIAGGLVGSIGGFFAGEAAGQWAGEKLWSFFEKQDEAPKDALEAAKKKGEEQKPSAPTSAPAPKPISSSVAPEAEPTPPSTVGEVPAMQPSSGGDSNPPPSFTSEPKFKSSGGAGDRGDSKPPPAGGAAPTDQKPGPIDKGTPAGGGDNTEIASVIESGAGFNIVQTEDGKKEKRIGTRNWRNNNPGNINYGSFTKGLGAIGADPRFAIFPSYEEGRKAKAKLLFEGKNYKDLKVTDAIARYAPPSENNTSAYQASVLKAIGGTDIPLKDLSSTQREAMLNAMEKQEGFKVGKVIDLGTGTEVAQNAPAAPAAGGGEGAGGGAGEKAGGASPAAASSIAGGGEALASNQTDTGENVVPAPAAAGDNLLASIKTDTGSILESLQAIQSNLGQSMTSESNDLQDTQMTAQNQAPAEPIVINNSSGGQATPPPPKMDLPKAKSRTDDNSFMRALAKDFSHPTAFTSVSLV